MKISNFLTSILFSSILVFSSCSKDQVNPGYESTVSSNISEDIEYYPEIGQLHNDIVEDVLTNGGLSGSNTYEQNVELTVSYLKNNYDRDITPEVDAFTSRDANGVLYFSSNPYTFLNTHKSNISNHLYERLDSLLHETESVSNNPEAIQTIISTYMNSVDNDSQLVISEKNLFKNMLVTFSYSVQYWYNYDYNNPNHPSVEIKTEDEYWVVACHDFIGGALVGSFAGPLAPIGAAAGFAGASIMCFID